MDIQKFLENFGSLFEYTEVSTISLGTKFRELEEWSSLFALSVMAMTDSEYNVKLKGEDIKNSNTIEDIFNIVASRIS